jgi:hypothetical protein
MSLQFGHSLLRTNCLKLQPLYNESKNSKKFRKTYLLLVIKSTFFERMEKVYKIIVIQSRDQRLRIRDYLFNKRQQIKCVSEINHTQFREVSRVQDSVTEIKPI